MKLYLFPHGNFAISNQDTQSVIQDYDPAGMKFEALRIRMLSLYENIPNHRSHTTLDSEVDLGSLSVQSQIFLYKSTTIFYIVLPMQQLFQRNLDIKSYAWIVPVKMSFWKSFLKNFYPGYTECPVLSSINDVWLLQ